MLRAAIRALARSMKFRQNTNMRFYLIKRAGGENTFSPITLVTDITSEPVPLAWRIPRERVRLLWPPVVTS